MLWKVGLKEQRERKNKSKVTQELVERKVKKNYKKYKQEKKRVTYTNEEKRETSKVKKIWETGQNKMIENGMFSRYVKEGKKSLKYT